MKLKTFENLFLHELRDLHGAGTQFVRVLPKMIKAADHPDLKDVFEELLDQARAQLERLDGIFAAIDKSAEGDICLGMKGLVEEIERLLERNADEAVRDAGLIGSAQRVAHYTIAAYGTARTYAKQLGHEDEQSHLAVTLAEAKATDEKLTQLALTTVNIDAAAASETRAR